MALEAVAMVYSNVLRDHVNKVSPSNMNTTANPLGCKPGQGWEFSESSAKRFDAYLRCSR